MRGIWRGHNKVKGKSPRRSASTPFFKVGIQYSAPPQAVTVAHYNTRSRSSRRLRAGFMDTRTTPAFPLTARAEILALRNSKIREVANAGIGLPDVLPFWFGEPDEVTPKFIRDAGIASIERGDTFYTQNFGIPE